MEGSTQTKHDFVGHNELGTLMQYSTDQFDILAVCILVQSFHAVPLNLEIH